MVTEDRRVDLLVAAIKEARSNIRPIFNLLDKLGKDPLLVEIDERLINVYQALRIAIN